MSFNINAMKCAAYLGAIGVDIGPETAALWSATEREHRSKARARRAELKKSCGHFRRDETRVISDECGDQRVTNCRDCGKHLGSEPWKRPPRPRKRRSA